VSCDCGAGPNILAISVPGRAKSRPVALSGRPGDGQVHGEIEPLEQPRHLGIVAGAVNDVTEQLQTPRTHRFLASWRFQSRRELSARPHRYGIFPKQDGLK
jgi:hypothetical protein